MITIHHLQFTEELVAKIAATIAAEAKISRRQLSQRICTWMDWRSPNGKLREVTCRKALLELDRRKLIQLPERGKYAFNRPSARAPALPAMAAVNCSLEALGRLELIPITSAVSKNSRIWNALLDAYHYLGRGPLCGAQIRYLICSERFGWLGGLSFSASAWRVGCRDAFIGWNEDARKHNLQRVVNNSRFLIAPMVKVPQLASHVLAQCTKRLSDDWQQRYSYRPVLIETFVERDRFEATSYRAANWQFAGTTTGRGRQSQGTTTKNVYLYPLSDDWKAALCTLPDGSVGTRAQPSTREPADWMEEEFAAAALGDKRLVDRLMQLGDAFFAKPTANIPQACTTTAAVKAAYRFFDNEQVTMGAILRPHFEASEQRIANHPVVLVAQDTSTLNYTHHPMTEGLGPINTIADKNIGLLLHDTMAFTPDGTPLGLLDVQYWARDPSAAGKRHQRHSKTIEQKESFKWIESYRNVCAVQARCPQCQIIVMADREADIHELFAEYVQTAKSAQLLIRAEKSRNRNVVGQDKQIQRLWALMDEADCAGTVELSVPPRKDQSARLAILQVRFAPVTLKAPKRNNTLPDVPIHAVYAKEIDAPAGVDEPIEWMLLSSVPVTTFEEAKTALARYARRWGIEVYHRVLKSGCRIKDRQLGTARRLENCLAIDMVVAWRIHHLTWLGRQTPDVPCTVFFENTQWKALVGFMRKSPVVADTPPTLKESIAMVATLGGFLNRKSDGDPGTETIWRGLQRLDDITQAYIAFVLQPQPPPVAVSKPGCG
ncbi:MAG: IS4 family transposase [Desulfosarcina sp.]|nr:IS4 family transposase [Desulfosarcina sp.]